MLEVSNFDLDLGFPDPKDFKKVAIVPVYIEPLVHSGERLFVGLVIQSEEGIESFPLESLARLECVYGSAYKSLMVARDIALASLLDWVRQHGIEQACDWVTPGEGIFAGTLMHTTAGNVAEAARASFCEYSSIYREPAAHKNIHSHKRDERSAIRTLDLKLPIELADFHASGQSYIRMHKIKNAFYGANRLQRFATGSMAVLTIAVAMGFLLPLHKDNHFDDEPGVRGAPKESVIIVRNPGAMIAALENELASAGASVRSTLTRKNPERWRIEVTLHNPDNLPKINGILEASKLSPTEQMHFFILVEQEKLGK